MRHCCLNRHAIAKNALQESALLRSACVLVDVPDKVIVWAET